VPGDPVAVTTAAAGRLAVLTLDAIADLLTVGAEPETFMQERFQLDGQLSAQVVGLGLDGLQLGRNRRPRHGDRFNDSMVAERELRLVCFGCHCSRGVLPWGVITPG